MTNKEKTKLRHKIKIAKMHQGNKERMLTLKEAKLKEDEIKDFVQLFLALDVFCKEEHPLFVYLENTRKRVNALIEILPFKVGPAATFDSSGLKLYGLFDKMFTGIGNYSDAKIRQAIDAIQITSRLLLFITTQTWSHAPRKSLVERTRKQWLLESVLT